MSMITAEEAIRAYHSREKTPYQLDLEVKDRKPDIVPKVGDMVKIKSRGWYEKWRDFFGVVYAPWGFINSMADACGNIFEVERVESTCFYLKGSIYTWSLEMFEEVYPVQKLLSSKFSRMDLNNPYLYQSPYGVKGSELVLSKEEQERLKKQIREKWGVKSKLKQIKTTHLIKLKKL